MKWLDDTPPDVQRGWQSDDGLWRVEKNAEGRWRVRDKNRLVCGGGITVQAAFCDWRRRAMFTIEYIAQMAGDTYPPEFTMPEDADA